jgi:hypothetical protein
MGPHPYAEIKIRNPNPHRDPHQNKNQDPDPHQSDKLDPEPDPLQFTDDKSECIEY